MSDVEEADYEVEGELQSEATIVQRDSGSPNILPENLDEQISVTKKQVGAINTLVDEVLDEGVDYGKEKGIDKPFLHKPGAEQLCITFGLAPRFTIVDKTIDLDHPDFPLIDYDVRCELHKRDTGQWVGDGVGNCNSWEKKYRYRRDWYNGGGKPQGDEWEKTKGGNYYRRVPNDDIMTQKNTILKMAKKRAHVDAVLNSTGASRLFTQDEDAVSSFAGTQSSGGSDNGGPDYDPDGYPHSGKHAEDGDDPRPWKDVPSGYLEYMAGNDYGKLSEFSEQELERRENENGGEKKQNPREATRQLVEGAGGLDTDDTMELAENTVDSYTDGDYTEVEAWREVFKYLRDVKEGKTELKVSEDGTLETIPF